MRLGEGKIGKQESASLTGLAITMSVVFAVDGGTAYRAGNATYIALPLSILLALGLFLMMRRAMEKLRVSSFFDLCEQTLGKTGKYVSALLTLGLYAFSAWAILERFTTVMHGVVFPSSDYAPVLVWIVAAVAFIAMKGFECLGRMGKMLARLVGMVILLDLAFASDGYALYRLAPFPADQAGGIALMALRGTAFAFPPLLGLLCAAPALQGTNNVKRVGIAGALAALVMVALIQFCIALAYAYKDLQDLAIPLIRIDMVLNRETLLSRFDQLSVFVLLAGAILSAAYFVYSAAAFVTKAALKYDVRPAAASICATIAGLLLLEHIRDTWPVRRLIGAIRDYAWLALALFLALGAVALVRAKRKGGAAHETA